LKKLAKLAPTFHTRTSDSFRDIVINLRPSGGEAAGRDLLLVPFEDVEANGSFEIIHHDSSFICANCKFLRSHMEVHGRKLWSTHQKLYPEYNRNDVRLDDITNDFSAVSNTSSLSEVELGSRDFTTASMSRVGLVAKYRVAIK